MNDKMWQLRAGARNYQDAHQQVTKLSNRKKALERHDPPRSHPALEAQLATAKAAREAIGKDLVKLYKLFAPPAIRQFQEETIGLGPLYIAQLLGIYGDFVTTTEAWWDEDPTGEEKRVLTLGRTYTVGVRDVWAYFGHGDPERRHRRGATAEEQFKAGNPVAKSLAHMTAEFALRQNGEPDKNGKPRPKSPYYPYYAAWKQEAANAHPKWTAGHCHYHAIRKVAKAILKDLWRVQHGFVPAYGAKTAWKPRAEGESRRTYIDEPASVAA